VAENGVLTQLAQAPAPPLARKAAFLDHLHSLRALAIVLVVGGHVVWKMPWTVDSAAFKVLEGLCADSSVVFMFVAGFLFRHLHGGYAYLPYLRKKFDHVILPYLAVSVPAVAAALHGNPAAQYPWLAGHSRPYQAAWYYLKGGAHMNFPLWFVPMIALFFLAAPAFDALIRHPRGYWAIAPLGLLSALIHRAAWPNLDTLHQALYMLPAYLLGMCCSQCGAAPIATLARRRFLSCALLLVAWMLPILVDPHSGNHQESGYFTFDTGIIDWLFVQKMLVSVLLLPVLAACPAALHRWLAPLAATSFAVFFLHGYGLRFEEKLVGRLGWQGSVPLWLLLTAALLAACHGIALSARRTAPRLSRRLLGV
jgi:surface polysaccharide O-acyltransferase-like enzyme